MAVPEPVPARLDQAASGLMNKRSHHEFELPRQMRVLVFLGLQITRRLEAADGLKTAGFCVKR